MFRRIQSPLTIVFTALLLVTGLALAAPQGQSGRGSGARGLAAVRGEPRGRGRARRSRAAVHGRARGQLDLARTLLLHRVPQAERLTWREPQS